MADGLQESADAETTGGAEPALRSLARENRPGRKRCNSPVPRTDAADASQGCPLTRMQLEEALVAVWRQALVENANLVELGGRRYPVRRTQRRRLRQVDFECEGEPLRGIEQNPETKSRWAEMARAGKKVMQFTSGGRYLGNVAEGKLTLYRGPSRETGKASPKREKSAG